MSNVVVLLYRNFLDDKKKEKYIKQTPKFFKVTVIIHEMS